MRIGWPHRTTTQFTIVAMLATGMLLLAGCGGSAGRGAATAEDAADRYEREVAALVDEFGPATAAADGAADGRLGDMAARVGELKPPPGLEDAHHDLVQALEQLAHVFEGDGGMEELDAAVSRLEDADREFRGAGVDISPLTGIRDVSDAEPFTVDMAPQGAAGVSATARVQPEETSWQVRVEFEERLPDAYIFVYEGSCSSMESALRSLEAENVASLERPGDGVSVTTSVPPDSVDAWQASPHAIVLHSENDFTTHSACGDVPHAS